MQRRRRRKNPLCAACCLSRDASDFAPELVRFWTQNAAFAVIVRERPPSQCHPNLRSRITLDQRAKPATPDDEEPPAIQHPIEPLHGRASGCVRLVFCRVKSPREMMIDRLLGNCKNAGQASDRIESQDVEHGLRPENIGGGARKARGCRNARMVEAFIAPNARCKVAMAGYTERDSGNCRRENYACRVRDALRERNWPKLGKSGSSSEALVTSNEATTITRRFAFVASTSAPAEPCRSRSRSTSRFRC
jgi:hypothetical protein